MTIPLTDGRRIDSANIIVDESSQVFYFINPARESSTGEKEMEVITNLVYRKDKKNFDGYNEGLDNLRLSNERYAREHQGATQPGTGDTSTGSNFFHQLTTDPLAAPLETVDRIVKGIVSSSGVKTLAVVGIVGLTLYLITKKA